jgi:hypothetical protein
MTYIFVPKNPQKYLCNLCDYTTSNLKDYNKHLLTRKHKILTTDLQKIPKNPLTAFQCGCGKEYKHRQSLYSHKKRCSQRGKEDDNETALMIKSDDIDYKTLFYRAMDEMKEQRQDFIGQIHAQQEEIRKQQDMMGEMIDKVSGTTINNNHQTNNFNIQMFLNETCKDAINLSEFIERIEVSHDDLENNAQLGFVNGITKIFIDNLRNLTLQQRPIHCTDVKRETLYIKDKDQWDKDSSIEKLENAIKEVSRKSILSLSQWKKTNPDYRDMDSEFSKKCIDIQQNSMGLSNKSSYYPKIIHNLAKENTIAQLKL